jgi:NADH:ubiquinone oxidoreductase subunit E
MKTVTVCIGSSCHLKGSYDVVHSLENLIEEHKLDSKVIVKASFCLGECTKGVSVKINEGPVISVNKEDVNVFFNKFILEDSN